MLDKTFYKGVHGAIAAAHLVLAAVAAKAVSDGAWFQLSFPNAPASYTVNINIAAAAVSVHAIAFIFHAGLTWRAASIIEQYIAPDNANPLRWTMQIAVEGISAAPVAIAIGMTDPVGVTAFAAASASVIGLCSIYDDALDREKPRESYAHTLAIVTAWAIGTMASCAALLSTTLPAAVQTAVGAYFIVGALPIMIQRVHIRYREQPPNPGDLEEDDDDGALLEYALRDARRGATYDALHAAAVAVRHAAATWVVLKRVLHSN